MACIGAARRSPPLRGRCTQQDGGSCRGPVSRLRFLLCLLSLLASPASARSRLDTRFQSWLSQSLWPEAKATGVSKPSFDAAFDGIRPNAELPVLVLPGQKPSRRPSARPIELSGKYFAEKTIGAVTKGGRARAGSLSKTLAGVEEASPACRQASCSPSGAANPGSAPAQNPPMTLSKFSARRLRCPPARTCFARTSSPACRWWRRASCRAPVRSSWAGALGQPQFLPTSFLKHATDGDGDGRADIWNSQADTVASIANYLVDYGFARRPRLGLEVNRPQDVSCALEGPDQGKPIADWAAMGVAGSMANPFRRRLRQGRLSLDASRAAWTCLRGDAEFLCAEGMPTKLSLYALFMGRGADRVGRGRQALYRPLGRGGRLAADVAALQKALEARRL